MGPREIMGGGEGDYKLGTVLFEYLCSYHMACKAMSLWNVKLVRIANSRKVV